MLKSVGNGGHLLYLLPVVILSGILLVLKYSFGTLAQLLSITPHRL